MHIIKVLGSGCASCQRAIALIESVVTEVKADAKVVKEEDLAKIMGYGVMSTPAVVIDEELVHMGMPSRAKVHEWIAAF